MTRGLMENKGLIQKRCVCRTVLLKFSVLSTKNHFNLIHEKQIQSLNRQQGPALFNQSRPNLSVGVQWHVRASLMLV